MDFFFSLDWMIIDWDFDNTHRCEVFYQAVPKT